MRDLVLTDLRPTVLFELRGMIFNPHYLTKSLDYTAG